MATFVEVGQALAQVRDAELYRETDGTFEKYARRRWDMQKSQAYRMIESSAITRSISPRGDIERPRTERQARPLAPSFWRGVGIPARCHRLRRSPTARRSFGG